MRRWLWFTIILLGAGCSGTHPLDGEYRQTVGDKIRLDSVARTHHGLVLFYLSPECPLCQNYTVTINQIVKEYQDRDVAFYGVVSGEFYTSGEVEGFKIRYDLNLPIIMDPGFDLADHYQADITPEAHLLDSAGQRKYSGAIDNWAISLGQKRLTITEHYLRDALSAFLANEEIDPAKTDAVGCFIE